MLSVADQLLYSLSNFVLTILVARIFSPTEFGAYSVLLASFLISSAVNRGLVSEPLVVRHSAVDPRKWRRSASDALIASATFGLLGALPCVAASLLTPKQFGPALLALAASLPFLFMQDSTRYIAIGARRPGIAIAGDTAVAVVEFGVAGILIASGSATVAGLIGAWGIGGLAGTAVAVGLMAIRPQGNPVRWFREHAYLAGRYATEDLVNQGTQQSGSYVVAAVSGLRETAGLRGAQTIFTPAAVFDQAAQAALTPELVRVAQRSTRRLTRYAMRIGLALGLVKLAWIGLVLSAGRFGGRQFLGNTWRLAHPLILFVGVSQTAAGVTMGAVIGLRALGAANRSLGARVTTVILSFSGMVVGAFMDGARGVVIAAALIGPVQIVVWWAAYRRAVREHRRIVAARRVGEQWQAFVSQSPAASDIGVWSQVSGGQM